MGLDPHENAGAANGDLRFVGLSCEQQAGDGALEHVFHWRLGWGGGVGSVGGVGDVGRHLERLGPGVDGNLRADGESRRCAAHDVPHGARDDGVGVVLVAGDGFEEVCAAMKSTTNGLERRLYLVARHAPRWPGTHYGVSSEMVRASIWSWVTYMAEMASLSEVARSWRVLSRSFASRLLRARQRG